MLLSRKEASHFGKLRDIFSYQTYQTLDMQGQTGTANQRHTPDS